MNSDERKQLRKICCEEHKDIIRGRKMTDLESKIFHGWTDLLNGVSQEELDEILEPYIKK
jgi:hypothetical protein